MLTVTRIFHFSYAHHLPDYDGKCVRLHGHTGVLEVQVAAMGMFERPSQLPLVFEEKTYPGMVVDFGSLKEIVERQVLEKLDHHLINDFLVVPTAENMVLWVRDRLKAALPQSLLLVSVTIWETENCYAKWTNDIR
jgi:6-pyruvoyltetrahydropterin/6-carboxytetrahydropterin synthase